jgi:hypothetical protein
VSTDAYAATKASAQMAYQLTPSQLEVLHQLESVLQGIR